MKNGFSEIKTFSNFAIADGVYQPLKYSSKHIDHHSRISIVLQGKVKEKACGKEEFARCGSLVIKPGDMEHQNEYGPNGSRIISVLFKEKYFEKLANVPFCDWRWFHGFPMSAVAFSFVQHLSNITTEEELEDLILDLFAMLPDDSPELGKAVPTWLKQVEEKIRDEFQQPIQTKDLAEWMDVHPVYLARIFRKHFGRSIKSFLQSLRLENAIQELSEGKKTLVHIALDSGFSDQSHLNRELKKAFQMSPGHFRKWTSM